MFHNVRNCAVAGTSFLSGVADEPTRTGGRLRACSYHTGLEASFNPWGLMQNLHSDMSWLSVFDAADLREFVNDIREALEVAAREGSTTLLDEELHAWRVTAELAGDPSYRSILANGPVEADFVEVDRP
jgi:hypothetical protein